MVLKKKPFLTRHWIIAFIVFIAITSLCFVAIYGLGNQYDNTDVIDSDFNDTYNKMDEMSTNVEDMRQAVANKSGLGLVAGAGTVLIKGTTTVAQILIDTITLPGKMLEALADYIDAPKMVGDILFAVPLLIITIFVIFIIISALNRTRM